MKDMNLDPVKCKHLRGSARLSPPTSASTAPLTATAACGSVIRATSRLATRSASTLATTVTLRGRSAAVRPKRRMTSPTTESTAGASGLKGGARVSDGDTHLLFMWTSEHTLCHNSS